MSISRHAFSQARHCSAHSFIIVSLACLSHSAAHLAQASAQAVQIGPLNTPFRATMREAAAQISAQSKQVLKVAMWWLLPSPSCVAQCRAQASQLRWHFEQASAHLSSNVWRLAGSAPAVEEYITANAKADKQAVPNARRPIMMATSDLMF
ncbi:MAG TPA: hypothetical protein VGG64_15580 [Pirellulales bacterium]